MIYSCRQKHHKGKPNPMRGSYEEERFELASIRKVLYSHFLSLLLLKELRERVRQCLCYGLFNNAARQVMAHTFTTMDGHGLCLSVWPPVCLWFCLSVGLCLSVCVCVCLSLCHPAGTSVMIHPGSCLFGQAEGLGWILFHEIVLTSKVRLWCGC